MLSFILMIKRVIKTSLGTIILILGIIGLAVPILQGWLMIILGILLIAPERGKKITDWIKSKIKK
ncbi:hypothetical protein GF354_04615 [Candidatus Peregrinibacteria bacterium]|nr:hypothetical protein [Candidatus Peregrinibacteria bacterium]